MLGYDTLHFFLPVGEIPTEEIDRLCSMLQRDGVDKTTGERWSTGNIANCKVTVSELGVSIKGSVAGFYYPTNTLTVSRQEARPAIEKLSDTLHLDLFKANVSRVDVSASFLMQDKPQASFDVLGGLSYFYRQPVSRTTLYYHRGATDRQTLCFYDKEREVTCKREALPQVYADCGNVLRYEARLNGRVANQMNEREVTGATLCDGSFFKKIGLFWADSYNRINKTYTQYDMSRIKNAREAKDFLCGVALAKMGAGEVNRLIAQMKAQGVLSDPKYYTRLKRMMAQMSSKGKADNANDLASELDADILTEKAYL